VAWVGLRLDTAELRRLDEAVEEGGDLGAPVRAGAVVVLPPENDAAEPAFSDVVIHWDARIIEESRQTRPQPQHVADGLTETAFRKGALAMGPRVNRGHDRRRALLSSSGPARQCARPELFTATDGGAGTLPLDA
jgi:hypothetical protein